MKLERHNIITPAREIKRTVLNSLTSRFPNETCLYIIKGDFELKDLENGLARAEKFQSEQKRRSASSNALAATHADGGQTETGGGARGRGRQGRRSDGRHDDGRAVISSKDIRGRCTPDSSTSRPRRCHTSRPHGSSTTTTTTSRDFRSHNSRDRSTSSPTPGAAGREHLTISSPTPGAARADHLSNSGEEERITSGDHNIGEEISHTSSASCVSSAATRSISLQTA